VYVVAQRVLSPGGRSGVNAFLFFHGDVDIPGVSWNDPDVDIIANAHPGTLALQRVEQPSGGNVVVSYLDIVAPDAVGFEQLGRALLEIPDPSSNAASWSRGVVAIRFVTQSSDNHASEFGELRRRALLILLIPDKASAAVQEQPLTLLAQDVTGVGMVYRLDSESAARLSEHNRSFVTASIHIAYEDMDAIKRAWGEKEYHAQIMLALTGSSLDALRGAGKYEIKHVPTALVPSMVAASRDIPGQIDGDWLAPQSPTSHERAGWPTGALLLSKDGAQALDLVFVESAWFPMSEAALYTYPHSTGLLGGESWRFVARGSNETFEIAIGASLTREEVTARYGREAGARSSPDDKTVQLLLNRLPSS